MEALYIALTATISLFTLFLGFKVFQVNKTSIINRSFAVFTFITAMWLVLDFATYQHSLINYQTIIYKVIFSVIILMVFALAYFINYFPRTYINLSGKTQIVLSAIVAVIVATCLSSKLIVDYAYMQDYGSNFQQGKYFTIFIIYVSVLSLFILVALISKYIRSVNYERKQLKYLLYGLSIFIVSNLIFNLFIPILTKSFIYGRIGTYSSIFFVGFIAYDILTVHLFDIRVIIRKIFLYTALLTIVFGVYALFAFLLTAILPLSQTVSSFLAAAAIAFGFEPLRRWLQTVTEEYLFVADYKADEELKHLTEALSNVVDLDEALRHVIQKVTRAMRLSRAAALVLERDDKKGVSVKRIQEVSFPGAQRLLTDEFMPIVQYFQQKPTIQLVVELQQELDGQELTEQAIHQAVSKDKHAHLLEQATTYALKKETVALLTKLKIGIVVPIIVKEQLIGLLYFGDKLSNDSFYEDDLIFLTTAGAQTGSAIEKARFYEEDQLKSEFVSIASHELLTPTAAIEGYLSMILDEKMAKVDPKAEEYLRKVFMSAQRLSTLVKDLLSVSRIEAGRMKVEPKIVDLNEIVQQQIDQLIMRARDAQLSLKYTPPKKEVPVFADPERVAQVIVNLVGNAIKYTKKGGVTVTIEDRVRQVEVVVTDTGIGIKPEDREHLFEKFYRISSDETTGIMGTGLGLYITKSIVEMMHGAITVKSTIGQGSTFAFSLPKKKEVQK